MIVDILDVGRAHHVQVLRLELFVQELGDQGFQYPLPDIGGELLLDQGDRHLAGPETGQLGPLHDVGDDAVRLALNLVDRDGNLQRVLAAFN